MNARVQEIAKLQVDGTNEYFMVETSDGKKPFFFISDSNVNPQSKSVDTSGCTSENAIRYIESQIKFCEETIERYPNNLKLIKINNDFIVGYKRFLEDIKKSA